MEQRAFNLRARLSLARKQQVPEISSAELGRRILLADLPGFKPTQVSSLELGYRYATWPEVEALAEALLVDPYWLASRPRPALLVPRAESVLKKEAEQKFKPKLKPMDPAAMAAATAQPVAAPIAPPKPAAPPAAPADLAPENIPVLVVGEESHFRHQMMAALELTLTKLGDVRLKPFEWRSWREYEKKIRAAAVGHLTLPD